MAQFSSLVDPNRDLLNQFNWLNPNLIENSNFNLHSFLGFSNENSFSHQESDFPADDFGENCPILAVSQAPVIARDEFHESKKRKCREISESSSGITSPPESEIGIKRKNNSGKGKRVKTRENEDEKLKDVVHVRARRGEATDSHSLAERVRRGKINERLKCLQDIVPGCYKTMGMAVMLDEIINYVQSLQNQVEFLSMKLTAASSFYDFNSESDAMDTMQRAKALEALALERFLRDGCLTLPI